MTWALVWTALKNRYVQYALIAVAVCALLLVARSHFINEGKDQGREEIKQDAKTQIEAARTAERSQALAAIAEKDAEAREARARADASEAIAAQFADLNRTLISQRAAVAGKVSATPDSELHTAITSTLGIRPANDPAPGYYPTEERAMYTCLLDRPICEKQTQAQASEIAAHGKAIEDLKNQVTAIDAKYSALAGYTTELERHYVDVYNLYPKKTRGVKCVYLWACTKKKIPVPSPEDLKGSKPK